MRWNVSAFASIALFLIIIAALPSVSAKDCDACHGTSGDYTFVELSLSSTTARTVEPGTTFDHILIIEHPGKYDATGVTVTINLENAPELNASGELTKTIPDFGSGTRTITFEIEAGDSNVQQVISTTLTYSAEYHFEPTEYSTTIDTSISLGAVLVTPSVWNMDLKEGDETTLTISAEDDIKNIQIVPSAGIAQGLSITPSEIPSLGAGKDAEITIKSDKAGSGKLNILFENSTGKPKKIAIDVNVAKKESSGGAGDIWLPIGAVAGVSSWIILLLITLSGGWGRPLKRLGNKIFKTAKIRKLFHCYSSYIVLALALFHGVELMATVWNGLLYGWTFVFAGMSTYQGVAVNLGTFAWISMVLLSVTGIFQRPLAKKMGYKPWQITHSTITKLALALATVHGAWLLIIRFILVG